MTGRQVSWLSDHLMSSSEVTYSTCPAHHSLPEGFSAHSSLGDTFWSNIPAPYLVARMIPRLGMNQVCDQVGHIQVRFNIAPQTLRCPKLDKFYSCHAAELASLPFV